MVLFGKYVNLSICQIESVEQVIIMLSAEAWGKFVSPQIIAVPLVGGTIHIQQNPFGSTNSNQVGYYTLCHPL